MPFTRSTKDMNIHQSLPDYPSADEGITAEDLEILFDSGAVQLQIDLNRLETELEASAAAAKLGAAKIYSGDDSAANVQAKLTKLYNMIQEVIQTGIADNAVTTAKIANGAVTQAKIADNSITENKMNTSYAERLILGELDSKFYIPTLSYISTPTSFSSNIIPTSNWVSDGGAVPSYTSGGWKVSGAAGNADEFFDGNASTYRQIKQGSPLYIMAPDFIVLKKISVTPRSSSAYLDKLYIEASIDGTNYTSIYSGTNLNITSATTITISNTNAYKYYKVWTGTGESDASYLAELNFNSGTRVARLDDILLTLSVDSFNSYYDGLKVSIKIPSTFTNIATNLSGNININSKGQKALPSSLTSNEYVELAYNGTSFIKVGE